jgi:hypothetical protein
MSIKPTLLMAFAQNDLAGVKDEANKIWNTVRNQPLIQSKRVNKATTQQLATEILAAGQTLFMFHFGGHADTNHIILDGFRDLDKIRLANLLLSRKDHQVQLMFLNGCLSYGHVGILTARGVKAIIATNVKINDKEAVQLGDFFYQAFITHGYTLKEAFQFAEAQVRGKNSFPVIVNPGEMDEMHPMIGSWTLFVHSNFVQVLDWKLIDFIKAPQEVKQETTLDQLKEIVNRLIANRDDLKTALEQMANYKPSDRILLLQGRLTDLNNNLLNGLIARDTAAIERNNIRLAIIAHLNNLD